MSVKPNKTELPEEKLRGGSGRETHHDGEGRPIDREYGSAAKEKLQQYTKTFFLSFVFLCVWWTMTLFHFFNCAILTFGPHAVYYSATPLSEYDTLGTSVKAALVYLATALVKLICLATFLQVSETQVFDPYQEALKAMIGFIDVAGLYFALAQLTHRNISQNHKFQAVGLGWAFADAVLHRFVDVATQEQAKDHDPHHIHVCTDHRHYAFNHKLSKENHEMAFPKNCWV
ncbi:hypothetical protein Bca4012_092235 [Brassica carinata]